MLPKSGRQNCQRTFSGLPVVRSLFMACHLLRVSRKGKSLRCVGENHAKPADHLKCAGVLRFPKRHAKSNAKEHRDAEGLFLDGCVRFCMNHMKNQDDHSCVQKACHTGFQNCFHAVPHFLAAAAAAMTFAAPSMPYSLEDSIRS